MNAEIAGPVGTAQLKQFHTVNIDMWHHPKYYKELRKRNKSDQVISNAEATAASERAPGQGLKQQASSSKHQAASKPEPSSGSQAASDKHQAQSSKHQASSRKLQAP